MPNIEQEIEKTAETMEKSSKTSKERLFEAIRALGPEGVRAKLPSLEKSERELLVSALEEMKKAVSMDDAYQAEFVQGKLKQTIIQEDKADDDQDEKMVKPEAATIAHQGSPTDGWEGQVIKAKSDVKSKMDPGTEDKDLEKIPEPENAEQANSKKKDSMKKSDEGKETSKKLKEMESQDGGKKKPKKDDKDMEKGKDMEKCGDGMYKKMGVPEGVDADKQERCVKKVKKEGKGKNPYAICNASMKKGGPIDAETLAALNEIRLDVMEQLVQKGIMPEATLVKGEMKRLLAEEDQDGDAPDMSNAKTRASKEDVKALDLADDNKDAQKKVNDEKQGKDSDAKVMKKSVGWSEANALLKAHTGGRNHHFSLEEYINTVLKETAKPAESLAKSQSKKEDLNDIIEKGGDRTWDHIECDRLVKSNGEKINGKLVKSFKDDEIAQALGLTEEEAKKILGDK